MRLDNLASDVACKPLIAGLISVRRLMPGVEKMVKSAAVQNLIDRPSMNLPEAIESRNMVEVDDRFYKLSNPDGPWLVRRVFYPIEDTIMHAVIEREDRHGGRNVISVYALLDSTIFRPDRRDPEAANTSIRRRRRGDFIRYPH